MVTRRQAVAMLAALPLCELPVAALTRKENHFVKAEPNEIREGDVLYFVNAEAVDIESLIELDLGRPGSIIAVNVRPGMSIRDEIMIHRIEGE